MPLSLKNCNEQLHKTDRTKQLHNPVRTSLSIGQNIQQPKIRHALQETMTLKSNSNTYTRLFGYFVYVKY